jgi:hypothetical protein
MDALTKSPTTKPQVEVEGAGRAATSFTPQEEELFVSMARSPDIYQARVGE